MKKNPLPADKGIYLLETAADGGRRKRRMGAILVESGRLNAADAQIIVDTQQQAGLPFGENGVRLGILQSDDVRFALSVQFGLPRGNKPAANVSPSLVAAVNPDHPSVEAMKALRTQLLLGWLEARDCSMLSVVSAQRGDGRSFIAANLAIVFAELNRKTLLIDMDMRRPTLHSWFGIGNGSGLSDVLAERSASAALHQVDFCENLWLLTAGPTPPNPQELLSGEGMRSLIKHVRADYDVVITDTPSSNVGADAQLVAAHTRSAIVVSRLQHSLTRNTHGLVSRLVGGGVNVLGVVATEH